MASEDVNTAFSLIRFIKEYWGVIFAIFTVGALSMQIRYEKKRIKERLDEHDTDINSIKKDVQFIRENWVTEEKLDKKLSGLSTNIANAIIVKLEDRKWDGMERRGPRQ